jgi:hypothetical protein
MEIIQSYFSLLLFLIILGGPLPLGLFLFASAQRWKRNSSLAYFLLFMLTTWSLIQVSLGLILGSLGQLNRNAVVLAEITLFTIGLVLIQKNYHSPQKLLRESLPPIKQSLEKQELLVLSSIAAMGLFLLGALAVHPIVDYDSLSYHLPAIARWYQTARLTMLDPSGYWIAEHSGLYTYPFNWHILALLCVLPFHNDLFVA